MFTLWLVGVVNDENLLLQHVAAVHDPLPSKKNDLEFEANGNVIGQLDDLSYCSLGICVNYLYLPTQIREKYSTVMC